MAKYRAFFSYSSRDRVIGETLHRDLERYKIPRPLRGRTTSTGQVPKRLQPIFRDRSDLVAAASLSTRLEEELTASDFLIVLCTPAAAASPWVNREIALFRGLGRGERIVAVIADGTPRLFDPDTSPEGAFPPTLMAPASNGAAAAEPFAPDLRSPERGGDGFEFAKLKTVARILDIPLAELTQRQREAERVERRVRLGVGAAIAVLLAFGTGSAILTARQTDVAKQGMNASIETAIRQSKIATELKDESGFPSRISRRLFEAAEDDARRLITIFESSLGDRPQFRFLRTRLALALARFSEEVGDLDRQRTLIDEADGLLDGLETAEPPFLASLRLIELPKPDALDQARFDLEQQRTAMLRDANQNEAALEAALGLRELADTRRAAAADSLPWRRRHAQSLCTLAEVRFQAADPMGAFRDYQTCLETKEAIAEETGVSDDQEQVFDTLVETGKVARAVDARERSVELLERAVAVADEIGAAKSNNTALNREAMIALSNFGDALVSARRDAEGALKPYDEALAISSRLVGQDSERSDWQRDRALLLERYASALLQASGGRDDVAAAEALAGAGRAVDEAIELMRRLLARHPDSNEWQRDLSVLLEAKGSVHTAAARAGHAAGEPDDHLAAAQTSNEESIAIRRDLHARFPDDGVARHDLANALLLSAPPLFDATGDAGAALKRLDEAADLLASLQHAAREERGTDAAATTEWDPQQALVRFWKAGILEAEGRVAEALTQLRDARAILVRLSEQSATPALHAEDVATVDAEITRLNQVSAAVPNETSKGGTSR